MSKRSIDDPVSDHIASEWSRVVTRIVYNAERGNWERAERWASYLWALTEAAQDIVYGSNREDA